MNPKHLLLKVSFVLLIVIIAVLNTRISLAADQIVNVDFPCPAGNCAPPTDLPSYINTIYQFALGVSGLLALGMIIAGGVYYTVSAGNSSRQGDAKSMITSAIWGLVLLFGSYLILNTINPKITNLGLNFSSATPPESQKPTEPLVNSTQCKDFSSIQMNQGIMVKYPKGCYFRKNILDGSATLTNDDYYDDNIIFKTTIESGSRVWLYPYFIKDLGVSTAKCLIYAVQEKTGIVVHNGTLINTYGSTTLITLNDKIKLCSPQDQSTGLPCSQWTFTAQEETNGSYSLVSKSFQVNSSSFNYPDASNPPPTTGVPDKSICYKTLCKDRSWTCSAD